MEHGYSTWQSALDWKGDIPHYYGDYVRSLFITMAVLSFIVTPLWGDLLPFGVVPQVGASLLLVLLGALTSAKNTWVMIANATIAAVSVVLLEGYAIMLQHQQSAQLFLSREAGVLLMLAALYFAVKTARAMLNGKLGHKDSPLEFEEESLESEGIPEENLEPL